MGSRLKEDEKNERIIRNLLKIPENRRCINCNSLGPQYVCTNFSSFVCTTCSGIHREFTHRVKSVSMAKFTSQEVSALQGGGNASAREIYLKEWDSQRNSLPDGSNVERLRDFIKHVYVDKRYTGERNLEKPLKERMGETEDFRGNRRADTYQSSRSPPYDDSFERRQSDRPSPGGRSPPYDQDNRKNSDYKRSPARADVVNDWRREDRFGNGRRSGDRGSDGGSKFEIGSPDSQKDSDMSSPPIVRPVRDILGENVSPLRVIEPPPRATSGKSTDGWATQRTASSSSLASSETNPSEIKMEASFIDFDSVPEPPTVTPTQQVATDAPVNLTSSSSNDWANFDAVPEVKTYNAPPDSVESLLSGLSIPAPTSSGGSSLVSSSGNTALPSVLPPVSASAASHLPTIGGNVLTNAPPGGQWPNMGAQQHSITPVIGGSSGNQQWNSLAPPNAHGRPGASIAQMGQPETKNAMGTSYGSTTESSSDAKSGGRQALPEDLFALNYSYTPSPSPAPGWYSGSPYGAGVPMQYNAPMGSWLQAVPNFPPVSRSTNPFDVGSDRSPVETSTFPSVASLHEALPRTAPPSGLLRTSSLGTPQPYPPSMYTQVPAYATTIPPGSFAGQEITGSMAPRQKGLSGFGFEESAFASMNPNPQFGGLHHAHSASSNFTSTSGNPFG